MRAAFGFHPQFPDYPLADMPAIPEGFTDESYRNDVCPTLSCKELNLTIWVDYADPLRREFPEWERYRVTTMSDSHEDIGDVFASDDWDAVLAFIASRRES